MELQLSPNPKKTLMYISDVAFQSILMQILVFYVGVHVLKSPLCKYLKMYEGFS